MLTIDGLVTGIDTTSIIDGLLSIQQSQLDRFGERRQKLVDQQSAFKGVEATLLGLQGSLGALRRAGDNAFSRKTVTSSDETVVTASVSSRATSGTYHLRVDQLARAHQIASQSIDAESELLAKGTYTLQLGAKTPTDIVLTDGNNSLDGLAREINRAQSDMTALVITDSAGSRLLLSANETGSTNEINFTFTADPNDPSGTQIVFDTANPVQAAQDAQITLGSGAGAIQLTSASNQVDELIPGVTFDLLQADPNREISLTVAADTEAARSAVEDFVNAFNGLIDFVDEQQQFDAETNTAGLLLGNRSLIEIRDTVSQTINVAVAGANPLMNRLSAVGIQFSDQGKLTIQGSKLNDALNGGIEGVTIDDVAKLMGDFGESNTPGIRFLTATRDTQPSPTLVEGGVTKVQPYTVSITRAAARAQIAGTQAVADSVIIGSGNNTFQVSVDGQESNVLTLTDGLYTRSELAEHLQNLINEDRQLIGREVEVRVVNQKIQITSLSYGDSSQLDVLTGTANATLGFVGDESDTGHDVVGHFEVDGKSEPATGNGRILRGDAGNENTAGLAVAVDLAEAQVGAGFTGELTFTRGIASRLDAVLSEMLDPVIGQFKQVNDQYAAQIDAVDQSVERINARFESERERLVLEFARMEGAVSDLQSAGNFLAAQLSGVPPIGGSVGGQ